jgi:hypothetical protein
MEMRQFDIELQHAIDRSMARRREQEFITGIRTIRLELTVIALRDRVRELEASEWAELEEVT